jgi:hypothetical protein
VRTDFTQRQRSGGRGDRMGAGQAARPGSQGGRRAAPARGR